MRKKFYLDKANGKFMGVCAGIANYFNIDATIVRVGAVLITLMGAAPWSFILYGLAAWLAKPKPRSLYGEEEYRAPGGSTYDLLHEPKREIDYRLAEVEHVVASSNGSLAREIEELR